MTRTVEALEGLALLGTARWGPIVVPSPALLVPEPLSPPAQVPALALGGEASERSGARHLWIGDGATRADLRFEIPTPETSATGAPPQFDGTTAFVHAPVDSAAEEALRQHRPELVILGNARELLREGLPLVEAIGAIRRAVGSAPLIWAPRAARPNRVPLLLYLGVDVLDATEALVDAAEGRIADPELGLLDTDRPGYCECPEGAHASVEGRERHALDSLGRELRRARAALRDGRLRELAEARTASEPLLGELLRYADARLTDLLEMRAPVTGGGVRSYVLRESFRRPEARRFRARFLDRYRPPPPKAVLLLVPCSKTKPYRNSRSHRRFASAWEDLPGSERIHVVSVTSPLGVVPRELEDVPPARQYDIPVTGEWDEAERAAVVAAVEALLERGGYRHVLAHLDPREYEFLQAPLRRRPDAVWTLSDERSTSPEALRSLHEALATALGALGPPSSGALRVVRSELEALATFEMGALAAGRLFREPLRLHGRPWFQRLSDGNGVDLATWREERGLFHLTTAGGARIGPDAGITVEAAGGVELRGDLFSPGVLRADPGIRIGDAVVVYRAGELRGVGEAELPGPMMAELGRGVAVSVRHRAHPAAGP